MMDIDGKERERLWKEGTHIDADGKRHLLKDMNVRYLTATIKAFPNLDHRPLQKEIGRRERKRIRAAFRRVLDFLKAEQRVQASNKKQRLRAKQRRKAITALSKYLELR